MGATEEQMQLLSDAHVTHVAYILILYSIAFLLFLFVNMLIHLYAVHAWGQNSKSDTETPRVNGLPNGHANGHVRADRRVRDAEEFELEGLISEDEDAEDVAMVKEGRHLAA
jgi:hypothetical protein